MDSAHLTQLANPISDPENNPYELSHGTWPVLHDFPTVPDHIMNRIKSDASGSGISNHFPYLSLGLFFIETGLLKPHPTQRPLQKDCVDELRQRFETYGIHRMDSPGVAIGLGNGWLKMKNIGPHYFKITHSSPHIHHLAAENEGPIAHIICGGHRTEAIKEYSLGSCHTKYKQNFWLYYVLAPGLFL